MRILTADDMGTQRVVLNMTLKKLGHEAVCTEDGKEAWERYQQEYFPVVITDWQMPYLDGPGLCRLIRTHPHDKYTYVIMLTTLSSKPDFLEAIEAGADDFLIKPYDEDLLAANLCVAERIGSLLTEAKQLQGLLPMCPTCKKLRAENGQWLKVDEYINSHTKAEVVSGTCPECSRPFREADRRLVKSLRPSK
jgi:CheY-like chemotaxis protein